MNKEILKLEEMLQENGIPFFFNYREENRPTPFGEAHVEPKNELLYIAIGPLTNYGFEAIVAGPVGAEDDDLLNVVLAETRTCHSQLAADAAFELINEQFLKRRAEWWPEVYGTEK